jgi:ubiquinone/menaquinone biosynthesis C-methylase UbiE
MTIARRRPDGTRGALDDPVRDGGRGDRDAARSDQAASTCVDYTSVAEAYNRTRTVASNVLAAWRAALAPYFDPTVDNVLDVGAGTGQFATPLAHWFSVDVVALEPTFAMRRFAETARQHPNVRYLAARCEEIPVATASIDRAWLSAVVHHFTDLGLAAAELGRVVKPGGLVLIRGFFRDLPLALRFSVFPGIERSAAAFPSTRHVTDTLARRGVRLVTQVDVIEEHVLASGWESQLRELRSADSLLRPLSDAEFESGVAYLRALPTDAPGAQCHRVTLRLLVYQVTPKSLPRGSRPQASWTSR